MTSLYVKVDEYSFNKIPSILVDFLLFYHIQGWVNWVNLVFLGFNYKIWFCLMYKSLIFSEAKSVRFPLDIQYS